MPRWRSLQPGQNKYMTQVFSYYVWVLHIVKFDLCTAKRWRFLLMSALWLVALLLSELLFSRLVRTRQDTLFYPSQIISMCVFSGNWSLPTSLLHTLFSRFPSLSNDLSDGIIRINRPLKNWSRSFINSKEQHKHCHFLSKDLDHIK